MSQQGQRSTDEDVARIQRRMRFENHSGVAMVIALTLGGLAVLVVPIAAIGTVLAVTYAVVFVATIGWMVGYFRTNRAFARIQSEPASRQPPWKYVAVTSGIWCKS